VLTTIPEDLKVHKTLAGSSIASARCSQRRRGFDWATAEALAFGTLLQEQFNVRLSGQDSGRGTFSHRHAVWVDQESATKYIPLSKVDGGRFEVRDSPLSEFGVLGFEYGYSIADPKTLVLWEAQFGDFGNGAQVIIDQFIAAGEAKWLRASGLVMLLPHGYEGSGTGAQLCASRTLSAALRAGQYAGRQLHDAGQLLPHPEAPDAPRFQEAAGDHDSKVASAAQAGVSSLADFTDSHFRRILSDPAAPADADVRRLVLCSGKVAYDLMEARDKAGSSDTAIVRVEQLYPFPSEPLIKRLKRMTNLEEVVWAQEEPKNNGYWSFVEPLIEQCLAEAGVRPQRPVYAGREASASPATGLAKRHAAEQAALIAKALGHSSEAAPHRKAS
jgi:2-oxoglutarate dehydrogenase E1 component